MNKSPVLASLLLALSPLAFTTALAAQDAPAREATTEATAQAPAPVWPFEKSDVPVDPGYTFGRLDNGMRYVIRRNATPAGTALVRMRIDSGTLVEKEDERGLAHYIEHMAFNGSKGVPEGEMIKLLEREGLAFGADTNASTGFDAITYMLNLPRNDEALLGTALMLMRETASELTIAQEAVERERGVLQAERRDRSGFQLRNFIDRAEFLGPDALFGERLPVGTAEVLEGATAAQLRALYQRTYTPSNTVLIVVGDYPVEVVEAAIRARFTDWVAAPAPAEGDAGPLDVTRKGLTDIFVDPAMPEGVTISRLAPWRDEPDTIAKRRTATLRGIGYAIINRRLARLARGGDAPFKSANFSSSDIFKAGRITGLAVNSADGEWKKGVLAALREVNQALTFGFTQAEVGEQIANNRTALENGVKSADTRDNAVFAGAALALASDDRVPVTPEWQLGLFETIAPEITPQAVWQAVLADAAPLAEPLIRFEGRTAPEGGEAALRGAFAEGMALPIAAPVDNGPLTFGYTDFGAPGTVVADAVDERLGIRQVRFANGVRLNLKRTDLRKDRVSYALAIDGGELMNTRDAPLRVALADSLTPGGLGKHSQDELTSVLAGRSVGLGFGAATDAFASSGTTTPRDLLLQMQVITALVTDPGYRSEGEERFRKGIENFFATLDATPGQALGTALGGILSDNDPRFTLQSKEAYFALDYAGLKTAIDDRLARGAIELALVGDVDEAEAIAAVAATFGALPQREAEFLPRSDNRSRSFTATRGERVLTHKGEADQALLYWVWPTIDDSDHAETVRLNLLARIVQLESLERLREQLGQAYSAGAGSSPSRHYPGYGDFTISTSVAAEKVAAGQEALRSVITELRAGPRDQDVIERARKPVLEEYKNILKDLGGWVNLTARAQSEPDRIDRFLATPQLIEAITPEDIHQMALKYLDPDKAVEFTVLPEAKSE
jgi:zinc protease